MDRMSPSSPPLALATRTGVGRSTIVPSPNCPDAFLPQQARPPEVRTAQRCSCPPPSDVTLVSRPAPPTPFTATGVDRFVVEPSPNCP